MNLLAPLFLAGLGLIAAPIFVHLIRRIRRDRFSFSTLRFLEESPPRMDRRRRVEHPWLLLLRILIVVLLVLAFTRPYWQEPDTPVLAAPPRQVVALIDTSASMQRSDLWDQATEQLLDRVGRLGPSDAFALVAFGAEVRPILTPSEWQKVRSPEERVGEIRTRLANLGAGWGNAPLDQGVEVALEFWEEMAEATFASTRRELWLVSDFAEETKTSGLASVSWPAGSRVELLPVAAPAEGNAALGWRGWNETSEGLTARVQVTRSFDVAAPLSWSWESTQPGVALPELPQLDLLPGSTRVFALPWPGGDTGGARLTIRGDAHGFDNTLWLVPPTDRLVQWSWWSTRQTDDARSAAFFVSRALAGIPEPRVTDDAGAATNFRLVFVEPPLAPERASELAGLVKAGAVAVVLPPPSRANAAPALVDLLQRLTENPGWQLLATGTDRRLGEIDFAHPLFAPFVEPRFSDFSRIRFWHTQPVEAPAGLKTRTLARFDDESPALLEVPLGSGKLLVWGSNWAPDDSQYALSSKFVPGLQALVEQTAGGRRPEPMLELPQAQALLTSEATWRRVAPREGSAAVPTPGVYAVGRAGAERLVAVQVPASESQLEPLALGHWEQLGVPVGQPTPARSAEHSGPSVTALALEQEQAWWRTLLWAVLAFLAVESVYATWLSRGSAARPEPQGATS